MEEKKIDYNQIFRNSGIILLLFIVNTLLLTTSLFFIHIEISIFHAPIAFLISVIEIIILYKKKTKIQQILTSILLSVIVLILSIIIVGQTYDISWDGNTYHKTAVGSLKNGWNPVYEKVEEYTIDKGNKINVDNEENNKLWINHYPKASWIFSATIYSITNNIESAKIINMLMMYIGFSIIVTYINKKINIVWAIILSLLIVVNPITVPQVFTYYVDGLLGISLFVILYCLLTITDLKTKEKNESSDEIKFLLKEHWWILGSVLIFIINLKFTGMVYAAIFCFLFYIYWLYQAYKNKDFKEEFLKYTSFYVIVVMIAVVIVGYSSYMKNLIDKGHPFYPLFGNSKVDIITYNQPYSFKNKNVIKKFSISMMSKGSNVSYGNNKGNPELKIPFTIEKKEIRQYAEPDTRMAGFGPLYSGIFIISCCIVVYSIYDYAKRKKYNILIPYLLILLGMGVLILATDGSWWARYTPYLYLLPIFNVIYLINEKNIISKVGSVILGILLIANISIIIYANCSINIMSYSNISKEMKKFENYINTHAVTDVALKTTGHEGLKYNIVDLESDISKIRYVKKIEKNREKVYQFSYRKVNDSDLDK